MWTHRVASITPSYCRHEGKVRLLPYEDGEDHLMIKQIMCIDEENAQYNLKAGSVTMNYDHPNICPTLECVRESRIGGRYYVYIVMPRMVKNLKDDINFRFNREPQDFYSEEDLFKHFNCLLDAFAYMQSENIAHRDIKPENILLDEGGTVKICDFGSAKQMNIDPKELKTLAGTLPYFSPNLRKAILEGSKDDSSVLHNVYKSDVYSLGVTMLHLTLFELPKTLTNLRNLQETIDNILNEIPNYSSKWREVLGRMLTVDEERRPDFVRLKRELEASDIYQDDEFIEQMTVETVGKPLFISMTRGLDFLRVCPERTDEMPCLLSLKAEQKSIRTYSIDIVCVVDLSGSMEGEHFTALKDALCELIDLLQPSDRLCLITFSNTATRCCPLRACVPETKSLLKEMVQRFTSDDLTNIFEGFTLALNVLNQRRQENSAAAILLFTDGVDTVCENSSARCLAALKESKIPNLNVHCFGFGENLDGGFLADLAAARSGQFQHLDSADNVKEAFSMVMQASLSTVARNIRVSFRLTDDSCVKITNIFSINGEFDFSVSDVSVRSPKEVVFMVKAEQRALSSPVEVMVADVKVQFTDNEKLVSNESVELRVKLKPWSDIHPTRVASVFSGLWKAKGANELLRAKEKATKGHLGEAATILDTAIRNLESCEFAGLKPVMSILNSLIEARSKMNSKTDLCQYSARLNSIIYSHVSQNYSVATNHTMAREEADK